MLTLILIFATVHSGMASLRETAENIIGERAYRVLFAGISLPLVVSTVVSFFLFFFQAAQELFMELQDNLCPYHLSSALYMQLLY